MVKFIFLSIALAIAITPCYASQPIELGIIGMFPDSDPESKLAAQMAIEDINNISSISSKLTYYLNPVRAYVSYIAI